MDLLLVSGFMADTTLWDEVRGPLSAMATLHLRDLREGATLEEMARQAPDRITALILIATSSRGDTPAQAEAKAASLRALASSSGPFLGLSRGAVATSLHPDRARDEALIARIRAMGVGLGREAFVRQSSIGRAGDADRLGALACPTLVVAAREDRLRSLAEAEELRDGIPGAQLRIIERCGHMIPLEQPEALAAAMGEWLRSLPSPA
ncbi:MAG TPA: alpha/beta fold hydrolase [Candidatus Methylacidiphilales bacterium]